MLHTVALLVTGAFFNPAVANSEIPQVVTEGSTLTIKTRRAVRTFIGDPAFEHLPAYEMEINLSDIDPKAKRELVAPIVPVFGGSPNLELSAINKNVEAGADGTNETPENRPADANNAKPLDPGALDSLLAHANAQYYAGRFNEALTLVDQALAAQPRNARALEMKGSLLHVLGDSTGARKYWAQALKLDSKNDELRRLLEATKP